MKKVRKMGITYRQENNGQKHIIEVKEKWAFSSGTTELSSCLGFLIKYGIPFSVGYKEEKVIVHLDGRAEVDIPPAETKANIQERQRSVLETTRALMGWKMYMVSEQPEKMINPELSGYHYKV